MPDKKVSEYHFMRQRQCLRQAAEAANPVARRIHQELAAQHYRMAVEYDERLALFRLRPA